MCSVEMYYRIRLPLETPSSPNPIPGYKTGGRVKRTGLARVHKGEVVLTKSAAKSLRKLLNK